MYKVLFILQWRFAPKTKFIKLQATLNTTNNNIITVYKKQIVAVP